MTKKDKSHSGTSAGATSQDNIADFALRLLLEQTEENLLVVDNQLRIVFFNEVFGRNYSQFINKTIKIGEPILDYSVSTDKESVREIYQQVLQGRTVETEIKIPSPDGEPLIFQNKYKPIFNEGGEVEQIFVVSRDVSEERQSGEKFRLEQERLQKIMDQSLDLICTISNQKFTSVNAAVKSILGYEPHEFIGRNYLEVVHPDDAEASKIVAEKLLSRQSITGFENRYRHRDGHYVPLIWTARWDERDNVVYSIGRDATEQKKSRLRLQENEIRLKNAQKMAGIGHWEYALEGDRFICSEVLCNVLEKEITDELTFKDLINAIHPDDQSVVAEEINRISSGDGAMDIEHRILLPDLKVKYLLHRAHRVKINENWVLQGTVLDISDTRKQGMEQELSSAVVKALHQHESLPASLSHVLRLFAEFTESVAGECWIFSRDNSRLYRKATWSTSAIFQEIFDVEPDGFEIGVGLPGIAARTGKVEYWNNLPDKKRFVRREVAEKLELMNGIGIPILLKDRVIAVFTLFNTQPTFDWPFVSSILKRLSLQIGLDIQRKGTTDELNQFFTHSPHLIAVVGANGFYHRVNPTFSNLLGYTEKELLTRPFHLFVHPEDRNKSITVLDDAVSGKRTANFVNRYITKKGEIKYIQWYSSEKLIEENVLLGFGTDITELQRANEQLTKYKQVIEQSSDGIGLVNFRDNSVYINEAFYRDTGFSASDIESMGGPAKLYSEPRTGEDMMNAISQGKQWKGDVEVIAQDGNVREYYLSAGPVFDDNGSVIALFGIHTDISARKRHEEEMHEAFEEKNRILESISDGFFTVNKDGVVTYWNSEAERLTRTKRADVLGKSLYTSYPKASRSDIAQTLIDAIQSSKRITTEGYAESLDMWLQLTTYPSDDGTSVFFRNISDTKKAEAEKNLLLEVIDSSLHEVYMFSGDELKFEYVNNGALRNLGYSTEQMRNMHPWDIQHEYDEKSFLHSVGPLLRGKEEKIVLETLHKRKNGSFYPVEVHLQVNRQHHRLLFVAVVLDITERKQQEKALLKLNKQLSRRAYELATSNEELEQFAIEREKLLQELTSHNNDLRQFSYITSHNLRAPLSNIIGLLYLIKDLNIQDSQYQELLEGVQISAHQLQETIDDLGKIISIKNSPAVSQERIALEPMVQAILSQIDHNDTLNRPKVETDFTKAPEIRFNKAYLESVLLNLMTNAIKYRSTERELLVQIRSEVRGNKILVIFADNGIGIDIRRYKDRLFGLYQRFHPEKEGKGIGLFLVKSQMEALGGEIAIQSKVGTGTTFTLFFND